MADLIKTDLTKQRQDTTTPKVEPTQSPDVLALKSKITSGESSAADNYAYNLATGDNKGARNAMLGSKDLVESDKLNTKVSIDEAQTIKNAGVEKVGANVKLQDSAIPEAQKITGQTQNKPTQVKVDDPLPIQTPENVQQWKEQGSDIGTLSDMIESKYGTVTTQTENGGLRATIGDKSYEWAIDEAGNPIKTEVQLTPADKYRTEQLQRYMNASTDDIYRGLISGNISKEMETDLSLNPNFAIAKEKQAKQMSADSTNKQIEAAFNKMTGKEVEETNLVADMGNKMFQDKLGKGVSAEGLQSYKQFIEQDEKFTADVKELNAKVLESKTLARTAEDNLDRLTAQYEGVSKQSLLMLNARQNKDLYNQMDALNDDISNLQASVTYQEKVLDRDYSARVAEYNKLEERAYNQSVLEEQRGYNEQQEIAQLERQYDYTYGDLNSENETVRDIAIERAVADLYTNYPIHGMEVAATKVEKVKNLIAQGMTGSQALSQVEQEIRNTQSYKDMVGSFQRGLQPETTEFNAPKVETIGTDKDGNAIRGTYNAETGKYEPIAIQTSVGAASDRYLNMADGTDTGVQCGVFARTAAGMSSTPGGNSKRDRAHAFKDETGVVGGLVFFDGEGYDPTYGHISLIESINDDGTYNLVESNYNGDNKVTRRTIDPSEARGFYNDTPLAKGQSVEQPSDATQGTADQNTIVGGILNGIGSLSDLTATEKSEILPLLNQEIESRKTDDEIRNRILTSATYKKDISDTTSNKMADMGIVSMQLDALEDRLANQDVGPILGKIKKLNPYDVEGQVAMAQLAGLTPKVARGIFGEVGVLTDTDIANYQKALPNLTSTAEKNELVISFMRDLLAAGIENTISTQAKANRNMSGFLADYDKAVEYRKNKPQFDTTEKKKTSIKDMAGSYFGGASSGGGASEEDLYNKYMK